MDNIRKHNLKISDSWYGPSFSTVITCSQEFYKIMSFQEKLFENKNNKKQINKSDKLTYNYK